MRNNRYPQDYLPKIAYWYAKCWSISVEAFISIQARTPEWNKAWKKYVYFYDRQEQVYGDLSRDEEHLLDELIDENLRDRGIFRGML